METFSARLASFAVSQQSSKKGKSEAKTAKGLKWPHKTLSPDELANAGFYYQPSKSSPDNTTCYLCHSNLDGWEEGDDAIKEHIRHAPYCGWANVVAIEQAIENGDRDLDDPIQEKQSNARLMTFGSRWPHENKRGWVCKSSKMVEAGWYYCPTPESDDFVKCAYCSLSLDGWEPKDNPYEEHQRRSPDCLFFSLSTVSKPAKSGRAKKGRTSKASRMSTQSVNSNMADELRPEETEPKEESMLSVAESTATTKTKASKKGAKTKKEPKSSRTKNAASKQDNSQIMSSIIEPEDDDFEVKVRDLDSVGKGKKRKSAEMVSSAEVQGVDTPEDESRLPEPPAKKRRATRSKKDSEIQPNAGTQALERSVIDESADTAMNDAENDAEDFSLVTKPPVKKTAKGRKPRASSRSRKPSAASAASKASLRVPLPNDDEIDAALEEDLDRPLTDHGSDDEAPPVKNPKGRRATRSKTSSDTTASKAPARIAADTDAATTDDAVAHLYPVLSAEVESSVPETLETEPSQPVAPKAKTKKTTGRKASAKEASKDKATGETPQLPDLDETQVSADKPRGTRTRQDSQETIMQEAHGSNVSDLNYAQEADYVSTSVLDDPNVENGEAENKTKSNPSKKGTLKTKKKKNVSTSQPTQAGGKTNIEDVTETTSPNDEPPQTDNDAQVSQEPELVESETFPEPEKTIKPSKTTKATAKAPRVKKANAKNQAAAEVPALAPAPAAEEEEKETATAEPALTKSSVVMASASPSPPTPQRTGAVASGHSTPVNAASPQSSDAENQPPSSMPSRTRPPLTVLSPSKHNVHAAALASTNTNTNGTSPGVRIPLANITPIASPSKSHHNNNYTTLGPSSSRLHSTLPWTAANIELIFQDDDDNDSETATTPGDVFSLSSAPTVTAAATAAPPLLSSPEKRLTVEEWIRWKAAQAEERLRNKCESVVGRFEGEGVRALRSLEGIRCVD